MGNKRYKFSRYAMYNAIQSFFDGANCLPGKCLLIGDTLNGLGANTAITDMLPNGCEFVVPDYPEVDIQHMPYRDNFFDYVISDQVLEHVRKPWLAVEEVRRVLKPTGLAVLTSCLMQYIHGVPEDYFRFTPAGLCVLCENFSVIEIVSGHGSWEFLQNVFDRKNKPVVIGSEQEKEALKNDNKFLLMTWIIVRK